MDFDSAIVLVFTRVVGTFMFQQLCILECVGLVDVSMVGEISSDYIFDRYLDKSVL